MIPFSRPSEWQHLEGTCHELGHTWIKSCVLANLELTLITSYEGFKLYFPLYLLSELVHVRSLRGAILAVWKVLPHVLRSSVFLGINVGGALFFMCLLRRLIGRSYYYLSVFLPGVLGTACAILVERRSRRPLLAGYMATMAVELLYYVLKSRKLVCALPYGEVLIFSMAMAVLFRRYRSYAETGDMVGSVLQGLMSPWLPATLTRLFQASLVDNRLTHIILVGVWAFLLGYLLQTILSLLSQGTRLFKEKGKLKSAFATSSNVRFAAFLSSLAAGYKLANNIMYFLHVRRDLRLLLAGFAAGLSMVFYRSTSLSLYVAWKALEVLYSGGVSRGWWKYLPYGDVLIYALSTGWLFHGWFFESHHMRWSYWHFLRRVTWARISCINYPELDKFGTGASTRHNEWTQRSRQKMA